MKNRPRGGPPSESVNAAEIRAHLLRLQDARLFAHTGSYEIDRQHRTQAGSDLWSVFTQAFLTAQALGFHHSGQGTELLIERALAVAADPAVIDTVQRMGGGSAAGPELAKDPAAREPGTAPTLSWAAINRLALLYDRLDDWHRAHFPEEGRTGAASARSRSRTAAPDVPQTSTGPEGPAPGPRPRRR
ncbi:hypothetical protein [Kitasatospora sp. NPDC088783]|uniref:hypothetical protein n=1 Tax=Kitasatospora sp. NPDC088783 TaxID=3364077 RepID=UPI003802B98D